MNFFRVASLRIKGITSVPPAESHLCSVVMETFRFNHFVCKPIKAPTQYSSLAAFSCEVVETKTEVKEN